MDDGYRRMDVTEGAFYTTNNWKFNLFCFVLKCYVMICSVFYFF